MRRVRRTFVPRGEIVALARRGRRIDAAQFRQDSDRVVDQRLHR